MKQNLRIHDFSSIFAAFAPVLNFFSFPPKKNETQHGNETWVREKDLFSKIKSTKTHKREAKNLRLLVEMLMDAGGGTNRGGFERGFCARQEE